MHVKLNQALTRRRHHLNRNFLARDVIRHMVMIGKQEPQRVFAGREVEHCFGFAFAEMLGVLTEILVRFVKWDRDFDVSRHGHVDQDVMVAGAVNFSCCDRGDTHSGYDKCGPEWRFQFVAILDVDEVGYFFRDWKWTCMRAWIYVDVD